MKTMISNKEMMTIVPSVSSVVIRTIIKPMISNTK